MRRHLIALALFCLIAAAPLPADDKPAKKATVDYSKLVEAGPGVYKIEFDKAGRIESCLVVGASRISTVLGVSKGKEVARTRASLAADAEFLKWLKSKVMVCEKNQDETILFLEGREDNDKDAIKESGKAIEKDAKTIARVAKGLIRGMTNVYVDVNGKEKTYTLIKRWRSKTAKATRGVEEDNSGKARAPGKPKKIDKKIPDKKVEIDD
jgi:hypothetical protein